MKFYPALIQEEDLNGNVSDSEIETFVPISMSAQNQVKESDHNNEKNIQKREHGNNNSNT